MHYWWQRVCGEAYRKFADDARNQSPHSYPHRERAKELLVLPTVDVVEANIHDDADA